MYHFWRELVRPKSLQVDQDSLTDTYGRFVAEPLERGFGTTLGNALRRVLLSSIQGAAFTSVIIDGVNHEFSTIPDVKEDVSDIILNLKSVILKFQNYSPGARHFSLDVKGPAIVTAKDIKTPPNVEIYNPDQHIATLMEGAHLKMELTAHSGRGYVPAERKAWGNLPINAIPIDAVFSPIKKVNYVVTSARIEKRTDYDKLTLEVFTNGAIRPDDAVSYAAKILQEQLAIFLNFEELEESEELEQPKEEESNIHDYLNKTVDELELSVRAANCLANAGIKYIGELVQKTEQDMLNTKNFGRKSLKEIKKILSEMNLSLGMKLDNWSPPEGKDKQN